jgi:hypothetical protein
VSNKGIKSRTFITTKIQNSVSSATAQVEFFLQNTEHLNPKTAWQAGHFSAGFMTVLSTQTKPGETTSTVRRMTPQLLLTHVLTVTNTDLEMSVAFRK